jgi:hypothetical protein
MDTACAGRDAAEVDRPCAVRSVSQVPSLKNPTSVCVTLGRDAGLNLGRKRTQLEISRGEGGRRRRTRRGAVHLSRAKPSWAIQESAQPATMGWPGAVARRMGVPAPFRAGLRVAARPDARLHRVPWLTVNQGLGGKRVRKRAAVDLADRQRVIQTIQTIQTTPRLSHRR